MEMPSVELTDAPMLLTGAGASTSTSTSTPTATAATVAATGTGRSGWAFGGGGKFENLESLGTFGGGMGYGVNLAANARASQARGHKARQATKAAVLIFVGLADGTIEACSLLGSQGGKGKGKGQSRQGQAAIRTYKGHTDRVFDIEVVKRQCAMYR